jgi:hypothetical protein
MIDKALLVLWMTMAAFILLFMVRACCQQF